MSSWHENEIKRLFQKFPFYNTFIKKPKITGLKNIYLLHKVPFYNELNIYKMSKSFGCYARTYKPEIVDSKDPLTQLETSKSSVENLFRDVLDEIKGFKYQITAKVWQTKWRHRICSCLFQLYY